jgi:hypothetical protein
MLRFFSLLFVSLFFSLLLGAQKVDSKNIQLSEVGYGWAQNSVNATIFRKNSVVSSPNYQFVAYYDSSATVVIARRKHNTDNWEVHPTQYKGNIHDAHNVICIMVDGDGFLHLSWDHHNNPLHYCRSIEPEGLEMGDMESMIGELENVVSYPEFYRFSNGDLLFAYRDGGSGNGNLVLNKYNLELKKWSRLQRNLIDGEGKRNAYWQLFVDGNDVIHVSWVWRENPDVKSNHDMCYACSKDGGITWQKSNGEHYLLPIKEKTAEVVCAIHQGSNLINQTSMTADSDGNPYIATYFKRDSNSCTQFFVIFKDKEVWKTSQSTQRKLDFELGGIGSRSIPVSRPQLLIDESGKDKKLLLIYRDEEIGNHVCLSTAKVGKKLEWKSSVISPYSVDRWEPSFDSELWRTSHQLQLYFQKVGQGQSETVVGLDPQIVGVLEVDLH